MSEKSDQSGHLVNATIEYMMMNEDKRSNSSFVCAVMDGPTLAGIWGRVDRVCATHHTGSKPTLHHGVD